jgi:hypothetical protein
MDGRTVFTEGEKDRDVAVPGKCPVLGHVKRWEIVAW